MINKRKVFVIVLGTILSASILLVNILGKGKVSFVTLNDGRKIEVIVAEKDSDNVSLSIDKTSITSSGLTYTIRNQGDRSLQFGYDFYIVKRANNQSDKWIELSYLMGEAPNYWKTLIVIPPYDSFDDKISWDNIYGELSAGEYLFIKNVAECVKPEPIEPVYFGSIFTILS